MNFFLSKSYVSTILNLLISIPLIDFWEPQKNGFAVRGDQNFANMSTTDVLFLLTPSLIYIIYIHMYIKESRDFNITIREHNNKCKLYTFQENGRELWSGLYLLFLETRYSSHNPTEIFIINQTIYLWVRKKSNVLRSALGTISGKWGRHTKKMHS